MSEERIAYLINRINSQSVTLAEREEWLEWLQQPAHEAAIKMHLEKLLLTSEADHKMDPEAANAVVEAILGAGRMMNIGSSPVGTDQQSQFGKEIGEGDQGLPGTDTSIITEMPSVHNEEAIGNERKVIGLWKWLAAAVVMASMALGIWWMTGHDQRNEAPEVVLTPHKAQDVAPGYEGAILTLADGRQIVLDSAGNGALAVQGKSSIVKQGGQVRYQQKGKSANEQVVYNTMSTPKGRQYALWLADGTRVWLNAASSIKFPTAFTGSQRIVEITGEAYFEVAHDASKPFIVSVASRAGSSMGEADQGYKVEVLGTHFNINSYPDENNIKTTLLEGSVKISAAGNQQSRNRAILKPGQQALYVPGSRQLTAYSAPDLDEVMAWKNGLFHFNGASLQEVMRQIVRWYDVEVVYQGNIPERKFGGEISRQSNLSQVLKILEESKVQFTIEDKKLIVKP